MPECVVCSEDTGEPLKINGESYCQICGSEYISGVWSATDEPGEDAEFDYDMDLLDESKER
jgi:hypothetical protein